MSVVGVKEPITEAMHGRGGFPVKTLIYATFILLLVYMFYIYNSSQNSLREAEMTGSRYKREAEERVTEIQELVRAKDKFQETCQNEKTELHNRIKSLNQQYSMVQSQYKETEADFFKLRQDMDTMRAEHAQADSSHAAEYEKLKQEKDNDIAKFKDEVADLTRQRENLESTITNLRLKMKENEVESQAEKDQYQQNLSSLQNSYKRILEQNVQLQQQLQSRQYQVNQSGVVDNQAGSNVRTFHQDPVINQGQGQGDLSFQLANKLEINKDVHRPGEEDSNNSQHQMRPPSNNNNVGVDDGKKGFNDVNLRPPVNPNDEQKGQILEPVMDQSDKHQGGGEDGVIAMNVRQQEEAREKDVREEEVESLQHKNPLALGQIEVPKGVADNDDAFDQNKKDVEQQLPPLLNDENEQKEQDRGENHYFGEDEEAQQQQQEEQQQQVDRREEEEEQEEADGGDLDNNGEQFQGDRDKEDAIN